MFSELSSGSYCKSCSCLKQDLCTLFSYCKKKMIMYMLLHATFINWMVKLLRRAKLENKKN